MKRALLISLYALLAAFVVPIAITLSAGRPPANGREAAAPVEVSVPIEAFVSRLGGAAGAAFSVTGRSEDGCVLTAEYGGKTWTAAELAAAFGLPGERFAIKSESGMVIFEVRLQ